jgi:hypothetical protein
VKAWIFSRRLDLAVFVGPAVAALALIALGPALGVGDDGALPEWGWIVAVLLVDVAHVWSTVFVTYLDPVELRRRPLLYLATPLAGWAAGIAVYAIGGALAFWRGLAYLAVFHFVRQQYGWVMLYRARVGERDALGKQIDGGTIYLATIFPLLWWHAHLPRRFDWFVTGDFADGVPFALATIAGVAYAAFAIAYVVRAARGPRNWGKHALVATTAACWYAGIVATNSDYAFTVTNVLVHGVPYLALVYVYARATAAADRATARGPGAQLLAHGALALLATVWALAFVEELIWDRAVWHDRPWLFGAGTDRASWHAWLVPLLAVPQLTHYVLDGFLWRRRSNPRLRHFVTTA